LYYLNSHPRYTSFNSFSFYHPSISPRSLSHRLSLMSLVSVVTPHGNHGAPCISSFCCWPMICDYLRGVCQVNFDDFLRQSVHTIVNCRNEFGDCGPRSCDSCQCVLHDPAVWRRFDHHRYRRPRT